MIRDEVLSKLPDPDLRAYLVWIPMVGSDRPESVEVAASRVTDERVQHFSDSARAFGSALGETLGLPPRKPGRAHGIAWDVYLLYDRGVEWPAKAPPRPTFWMHQLGDVGTSTAPELDGGALRERLRELLEDDD